jgi:hypothetical protein
MKIRPGAGYLGGLPWLRSHLGPLPDVLETYECGAPKAASVTFEHKKRPLRAGCGVFEITFARFMHMLCLKTPVSERIFGGA